MGRRSGFEGLITAVARGAARAARQAEMAHRRAMRDQERAIRAHERTLRQIDREQQAEKRAAAAAEREAKKRYVEDRIEEAADKTGEVEEFVALLGRVLEQTLEVDDTIDFQSLRISDSYPPFTPPANLTRSRPKPVLEDYLRHITKPGLIGQKLRWITRKYEQSVIEATASF